MIETTNRVTTDTNVNVNRIVYRDNMDIPPDPDFPGLSLQVEESYNFLAVSGNYFSSDAYFGFIDNGGNKIYKGVFFDPLPPFISSFYYNYVNGTYFNVGMVASTNGTPPTNGWVGYVIINSINIIQ